MPKFKYSKQQLINEAQNHETRDKMKEEADLMYQALVRRKLLHEAFKNHPNKGFKNKPKGYWKSKVNVLREAKKYKRRTEFQYKSNGAWDAAHKNGWLEDCYEHMETVGNKLKRIVYALINKTKSTIYIGLTCDLSRRLRDHRKNTKINSMILEDGGEQVLLSDDYIDCKAAQQLEREKIAEYKEFGFQVLNIKQGGELGGATQFVTFKYAQNYIDENQIETINELNKHPLAASIYKNKWINELKFYGGGDGYTVKPTGYWTFDLCKQQAQKYDTRSELQSNCSSAYSRAVKEGWLDEIFNDHPNKGLSIVRTPTDISDEEFCYQEAKKFKYRKDFKKLSSGCYKRSCQKGWIKNYHFEKPIVKKRYKKYTHKDIVSVVKNCHNFRDLKAFNSKIYWFIFSQKIQGEYKKYLSAV